MQRTALVQHRVAYGDRTSPESSFPENLEKTEEEESILLNQTNKSIEREKQRQRRRQKGNREAEMVFAVHDHHHRHHLHHLRWAGNRGRIWGGVLIFFLLFMWATPKIPHSPKHHVFADMRNFFGVPNTLNVISSFPFLVVGIIGLVLCLHGNYLGISLRGEIWGWVFFYTGITASAFGSAYYHLKPDDARALWDQLPMMIAIASLFSSLIIERVSERIGVTSLVALLMIVLVSIAYERTFNDLRLCVIFHFIPCIAIPAVAFLLPPKYTHSRYWLWAAGFYLLAKFESVADKKVYSINRYIISGHSLEHLCLVMVPVMLIIMLWFRNIKVMRDS